MDRSSAGIGEFAERLKQYPLEEHAPVTFSAGVGVGHAYIEFVGISVAPFGGKGQVVLRRHLASEDWRDGKPVSVLSATVEFPTSYEYLRRFSDHLHIERRRKDPTDVDLGRQG